MIYYGIARHFVKNIIFVVKTAFTAFLWQTFMIMRSSIAFEDLLASSIASQVMPIWVAAARYNTNRNAKYSLGAGDGVLLLNANRIWNTNMFVPHSQIHLGGKERYITQRTKHAGVDFENMYFSNKSKFPFAIHCIVYSIRTILIAVIIVYGWFGLRMEAWLSPGRKS